MGAAARGSGAVALSKALQDDRDASVRRSCGRIFGPFFSGQIWWDLTSRNLGILDFWAHFLELVVVVVVVVFFFFKC